MYSGLLALGSRAHTNYPWAMILEEESRWVLRANGSSLQFDHQGAVSEIRGCDVEKIVVKRRYGEVFKIDIIYRDQRTRLHHYDRMDELLAFMIKISPDAEVVQRD